MKPYSTLLSMLVLGLFTETAYASDQSNLPEDSHSEVGRIDTNDHRSIESGSQSTDDLEAQDGAGVRRDEPKLPRNNARGILGGDQIPPVQTEKSNATQPHPDHMLDADNRRRTTSDKNGAR